jgi:Holliday junction resolvasome RuvABC ATP-dependent DNA helicase subunit
MATNPTPSARLALKVVPGSSRDQIVGWLGDALKIKVTAPPEKGRARGVPRLALRLTASARRVARADGRALITVADLTRACSLEQLDALGLGPLEQKYLRLLMDGPRRVNVLASALGVPSKTLSSVTEPFLIRGGLVDKDDASRRVLTPEGRRHLLETGTEIIQPPPSEGN